MKNFCEYCHQESESDSRGNCFSCGASRNKKDKSISKNNAPFDIVENSVRVDNKPKPKKAILVSAVIDDMVWFYAPHKTAKKMKEFGDIEYDDGEYILVVDKRYDVDEVVEYLNSLG